MLNIHLRAQRARALGRRTARGARPSRGGAGGGGALKLVIECAALVVAKLAKVGGVEDIAVEVGIILVESPAAVEAVRVHDVHEHDADAARRRPRRPLAEQRELDGGSGVGLDAVRAAEVDERR